MKQFFNFLLLCFASSIALEAQPVISSDLLPTAGTAQVMSIAESTDDILLGAASEEAQSWDFSGLLAADTLFVSFETSQNSPGSDSYPLSAMARTAPLTQVLGFDLSSLLGGFGGGGGPGGGADFLEGTAHYAINNGNGKRFILGIRTDIGFGGEITINASPPDLYLAPMELGQSEQAAASYEIPIELDFIPIPISISIDVDKTLSADAYGEMILPGDTFEVLRVLETNTITAGIPGIFDTTFTTNIFRFHSVERNYPVAIASAVPSDGGFDITSVEYLQQSVPASVAFDSGSDCLTVEFDNDSQFAVNFNWDFGDGSTSTEIHPTHTYEAEGSYTVSLTAQDLDGNESEFVVDVEVACPSEANFFPQDDCLAVTFNNFSDNGASYNWDFGDGNVSTEESPVHNYAEIGVYEVSLEVIGIVGDTSTVVNTVDVSCTTVADFDYSNECTTVSFENNSENAVAYFWSFGDETSSDEEAPVHEFFEPGTYEVILTVQGEIGDEQVYTELVEVSCPLSAAFGVTQDPENCQQFFFAQENPNVESLSWEFGDGTGSVQPNPSHEYGYDNEFTVTLTTTAAWGESTSTTQTVVVECGLPTIALERDAYLSIYPNPASDLLFIDRSNTSQKTLDLVFYNSIGQMVATRSLPANQALSTLSIADLSEGIHLVQLISAGDVIGSLSLMVLGE